MTQFIMSMILIKLSEKVHCLKRYWISIVVVGLILLATYDRVSSQEATPTPDVNTVPRLEDIFTPTSTPLPVSAPIVTATPVNALPTALPPANPTAPSGNQGNGGANAGNSTTAPLNPSQSTATQSTGTTANLETATETSIAQSFTTVIEQTGATLSLVAQMDRTYLWPSQTFTLYISLENLGAQPLTDLRLQYALPPELALQKATAGALGDIQQGPPTAGNTLLLITWPSLAAGAQTTATLTLQVTPQTPNGRLIDTQIVAGAAGAVDITAEISLVMPPAQLPQF